MRTVRIYQAGDYPPGTLFDLTPEAGQHVGVVLRMVAGDQLTLFSGDNREYEARITFVQKKKVRVEILSCVEANKESPLRIDLAQAVSKGERMEFVVQKAVELGVHSITPVISSRCVVKLDKDRMEKKRLQWQAIAIAACEQSGRNQVPVIHPFIDLDDYLTNTDQAYKLTLDPGSDKTWRDYSLTADDCALLIGPEGGFTAEEVKKASHAGFATLALGPRVLRTETAAIAAISLLQAVGGDL